MLRSLPVLDDYGISAQHGFLAPEPPLEAFENPYFRPWESVIRNLQGLLLSRRLRSVVDALPILSTDYLTSEAEWRRAYSLLSFIAHAYIWGGDGPAEVVSPPISAPFLATCSHFGLPPVATYAAEVLWNYKPLFGDEPIDNLENLSTLTTFTGSLDESWFYIVSVAIEAKAAPILPVMLDAFAAARIGDETTVASALQRCAELLEDLGGLLLRMYDSCDPHVFYHRMRPFLAGSKGMTEAGLPRGVQFDDGSGTQPFVQFSGGSNAQSSMLQFFDIALGIEHRPTGVRRAPPSPGTVAAAADPPAPSHNFINEMRRYMPKQHREFLEHVAHVANLRDFVKAHESNRILATSYDACLAMLRDFRDKHMQIVSRYIIVKSRESQSHARSMSPRHAPSFGLAAASSNGEGSRDKKQLRGTGGTALVQFLRQARDESSEPAIGDWARRILTNTPHGSGGVAPLGKVNEHKNGDVEINGLAGVWSVNDSDAGGGICHW